MFRRYPYWGWLLVSFLLWSINGYYFHQRTEAMQPARMANTLSNDLRHREDVFESFISEHTLIRHLFTNSFSEGESGRINKYPFFLYGFSGDTLKFWNTNTVIARVNDSALAHPIIVRNEKGIFIEKCVIPGIAEGNKRMVILFPLLITYPLENSYLKSHFEASDNIPVSTVITTDSSAPGAYPVYMRGRTPVFYVVFNRHDISKWIPDDLFIALLLASLLSAIWWVQLMVIYLTRNKSPLYGFITTFLVVLVCRLLLYRFGLPFDLDTLRFFSPVLYASSKYLSSLGDLFIDLLCVLWIVIFVTRHTPYKRYFEKIRHIWVRFPLGILLTLLMMAYVYLFVNIIRSLVLDSSISFDVSHYYSVNVFTILGLLIIGGITGVSCLVIYLFNIQLNSLLKNRWVKYLTLVTMGVILVAVTGFREDSSVHQSSFDWQFYWIILAWLLVFVRLLDAKNFTLVADLFEPHMIFWAVFICVFSTCILQYFNEVREHDTRVQFVKLRLLPRRDNVMEYSFENAARRIKQDKTLKSFFSRPTPAARKAIDQYLDAQYLDGQTMNKYQATVYLFNTNGYQLFNKDTTDDYSSLSEEKNESDSTKSSFLFYKENLHDRHFYLAFIPVYADTGDNEASGYVFIDFDEKKQGTQSAVYPELLQADASKTNIHDNEYAYAIYQNGKINAQNNDYPFPTLLKNDTLKKEQDYAFYINNNISELYYKISEKETIIAVHLHSELIELITLFSYLFVIQVILAGMTLVYQVYLSHFSKKSTKEKIIRLTLRRRVHFSMLAVVLISFIIIGFVTIFFFNSQYNTSNTDKLQSAMQLARQTIQDNLKQQKAFDADYIFDSVSRSNAFKTFVTTIANGQAIDINIFNRNGVLLSTSEDDIYNKGLISHMMRPDAYYKLNNLGKSIWVQNEQVASLSYLSAYQPLRDEHGRTLGYINVPFFSSEKDLNLQISNIVVTLINLYAFIFLFSSLITVFITRWITKSFNIIIRQFERINLQQNERISWPYDDEIGLLVTEYNKMVNSVEENAAKLAQSERESAWREMARQVAHEIKNPLTPMKLNIQFLQQAVRNDHPNIKELTDRVSYSIIEQIDNLSYIASEFSNFAKMPEARPEKLELGALLDKAVELYRNDAHVAVTIRERPGKQFVISDRSQLLRVFTNLLENARQAIPATRKGIVEVSITSENNEALITIADNGDGIPEEALSKLFQPYFTTKSSGTGLGLAMTKKIIEFWKGEITFETKEGVGTTFFIRLPLV